MSFFTRSKKMPAQKFVYNFFTAKVLSGHNFLEKSHFQEKE